MLVTFRPLEYITADVKDSPIITQTSTKAKNGIRNASAGPGSQKTRKTKFPANVTMSKMDAAKRQAPQSLNISYNFFLKSQYLTFISLCLRKFTASSFLGLHMAGIDKSLTEQIFNPIMIARNNKNTHAASTQDSSDSHVKFLTNHIIT